MKKAKEIMKYFQERVRYRNNYTEMGLYMPSELSELNEGIAILLEAGILGKDSVFCDAGSGDGRVSALISGGYRIPSLGVEFDRELVETSRQNMENLRELGLLNGVTPRITRGDFTLDETYGSAEEDFKDVNVFFNFWNNPYDIARKIASDSPRDTFFLLSYNTFLSHKPPEFDGLESEGTLDITISDEASAKSLLGVYRKN
ncbi:MAG: hypothetical protein CMH64_04560 [Nanoarchaeota archaeon]|nr:hypothetical protein [Nanoarchaeota archaeon]|tara:strand:- start:558 stop:1163 length:606 start_codon:yes stop_codon:yes gene_type:complete